MNCNVLIAEDDQNVIDLMKMYLNSDSYQVFTACDGEQALKIIKKEKITIALIDIMMPKMNGYELIRKIRRMSTLPIIVISGRKVDADRILGLNVGADVYLTKPFNPLEVVAYMRALLRRCYPQGQENAPAKEEGVVRLGELELDREKFTLRKRGKDIPLTPTELKILAEMMKCPDHIYTKKQLYQCVNGEFYESDERTMMVHISNLRSKIEDNPAKPVYIHTVRGLGYKVADVRPARPQTSESE